MPISRASFGLVTHLLDLTPQSRTEGRRSQAGSGVGPRVSSSLDSSTLDAWAAALDSIRALGAGALAEEVTLGETETVASCLHLQEAARHHGLEVFLRLHDLTDEALEYLREAERELAEKLAPGDTGPPRLQLMVDLGEPDEADLARWLPRRDRAASPRGGLASLSPESGSGGGWSRALAFSLFDSVAEAALRRLDRIAALLLEAGSRPGVEQPVWLAAFGIGDEGAAGDPNGVIKIAAHALSLGIERVFLAAGPDDGWWPADLRMPPPPLQALRTLTGRLEGASHLVHIAPGQYRLEFPEQKPRFLLWKSPSGARLPTDLEGPLEVIDPLGHISQMEAARLRLTDQPVFVGAPG